MKNRWKTMTMATVLAIGAAPVFAQRDKGDDQGKAEASEIQASKDKDGDSKERKVTTSVNSAVFGIRGDHPEEVVEQVAKKLKESGLDEKITSQVLDAIKKGLQDKEGLKNGKTVQLQFRSSKEGDESEKKSVEVKVDGEVVLVEKDGKEQRIQLRQFSPSQIQERLQAVKPWVGNGTMAGNGMKLFMDRRMDEHLKKKIIESMKENGVDEKVIDKVIDSIGKELGPKGIVEARVEGPRYVLGIALEPAKESQEATSEKKEGLVVQSVFDDSPADKGGIRVDDVIKKVQGKVLTTPSQLIDAVQDAGKAKKKVELFILRDGKEIEAVIEPKLDNSAPVATTMTWNGPALPEEFQKQLEGLSSGGVRGFVLPRNAKGTLFGQGASSEDIEELNEEISEVKEELEAFRKELKEIKELLRDRRK